VLFVWTPQANFLWDYLPLLDEAVVEALKMGSGRDGKAAVQRSPERYLGSSAGQAGQDEPSQV
jgi:hypothetical protein